MKLKYTSITKLAHGIMIFTDHMSNSKFYILGSRAARKWVEDLDKLYDLDVDQQEIRDHYNLCKFQHWTTEPQNDYEQDSIDRDGHCLLSGLIRTVNAYRDKYGELELK